MICCLVLVGYYPLPQIAVCGCELQLKLELGCRGFYCWVIAGSIDGMQGRARGKVENDSWLAPKIVVQTMMMSTDEMIKTVVYCIVQTVRRRNRVAGNGKCTKEGTD